MKKMYYIEFFHTNSEEENYDMQSKWFKSKKDALKWLHDSFDFICDDMNVFVMTAEFKNDSYDIVKSERVS